ncbi:TDP-N-acetylfucosamine:lipid II N-acetylfucosaminyltransferase [Anaerovibrio lipolyticus]|uniref:TDP-N-acetylfucosamine:lipid II N-acetylfucosaminyltransferase n=1 Tax=Anaerovibrio lipolyticus TaxID=82374 RepID=UPI00048173D4|nr:TDP-N-acetylfucosamine:lipid II N-acetylfucosaminyltransferase [Anaerovibrio lipolyticus]
MKIAIWGAGFYGKILKEHFENEHEVVCFFDNFLSEETVEGVKVYKSDKINNIEFDVLYISNMDAENVANIRQQIGNLGLNIISLYEENKLQEQVLVLDEYQKIRNNNFNGAVLHILTNDKFTNGYIDFMQKDLQGYNHIFFVYRNSFRKSAKKKQVYEIINMREFLNHKLVLDLLQPVKKIILSGIFDTDMILLYPPKLLKKTYMQFWGGDFYVFRYDANKRKILKTFSTAIDSCAGVLNLIHEDSLAIKAILGLETTKFYEVPMPSHYNFIDEKYKYEKQKGDITITLGNSATQENNHREAFALLKHLVREKVRICVPLSYGEEHYRLEVIQCGKEILGDIFYPMCKFIPFGQYLQYLANCDVGIYNNDRQQALGNIIALLYFGRKVYIRQNTSMASFFKRIGIKTYDVIKLSRESIEEILFLPDDVKKRNMDIIKAYYSNATIAKKWKLVLDEND